MAIAFDNSLGDTTFSGTSDTTSFTVTGSNTALVVGVTHTTTANVSSVTYNGVNLIQIHSNIVGEGTDRNDLWLLVGTATGANDIVVTMSASDNGRYMASSYTGVFDGGSTGGSDSNANTVLSGSGDHTLSYTTQSDDTWGVFYMRTEQLTTAGTNSTYRESNNSVVVIADSNGSGFGTAGAHTQVINTVSSSIGAMVGVALSSQAPPGPANVKSWNGVAIANIKSINGLAITSIKSINGVA